MEIKKIMGVEFNNSEDVSAKETTNDKKTGVFVQGEGDKDGIIEKYFDKMSDFENIREFFNEHNNDINNGLSRYHYNDSEFSFYKTDEDIKGEYITPEGVDVDCALDEFKEAFPSLTSSVTSLQASSDSGINGLIDETTLQGGTGDCWLLTAINALNSTEIGKEIISNAITVNDDGSATVTFAGAGVSYTISADEIAKYDTDDDLDDSYSNGDNDMLVLELAVEKLLVDIESGKVTLDTDNEDILYTGEGNGIDDGGLPLQMIYYLTGIESQEYYNENIAKSLSQNEIYSILSDAYENSDTTILTFGIYYGTHSAKLTDGSTYTLDVGSGGHALAITEVTEDTVTFVNPWDSSVSYTMSWSEFAKLNVGYISSTDLSSLTSDDTVEDTSDEVIADDDEEDTSDYDIDSDDEVDETDETDNDMPFDIEYIDFYHDRGHQPRDFERNRGHFGNFFDIFSRRRDIGGGFGNGINNGKNSEFDKINDIINENMDGRKNKI